VVTVGRLADLVTVGVVETPVGGTSSGFTAGSIPLLVVIKSGASPMATRFSNPICVQPSGGQRKQFLALGK
jgi:hypothetical protein